MKPHCIRNAAVRASNFLHVLARAKEREGGRQGGDSETGSRRGRRRDAKEGARESARECKGDRRRNGWVREMTREDEGDDTVMCNLTTMGLRLG